MLYYKDIFEVTSRSRAITRTRQATYSLELQSNDCTNDESSKVVIKASSAWGFASPCDLSCQLVMTWRSRWEGETSKETVRGAANDDTPQQMGSWTPWREQKLYNTNHLFRSECNLPSRKYAESERVGGYLVFILQFILGAICPEVFPVWLLYLISMTVYKSVWVKNVLADELASTLPVRVSETYVRLFYYMLGCL